jgi:hypothetical protein
MVGFLLVLTVGVFNLVLNELHDNNGRANYIKAYYGAEGGIEWALLQVKNIGYGVVDTIPFWVNNRSIILAKNPKNIPAFKKARDTMITFNINTRTQTFSWNLDVGEHQIIPLFYIDGSGSLLQHDVKDLTLTVAGNSDAIAWNIVGSRFWLAGLSSFTKDTEGDYKSIESIGWGNVFKFSKKKVEDFLNLSNNNYLILFNAHPTDAIHYSLTTSWINFFTQPVWEIFASGYMGGYKQNIKVSLDNTAYLSILKYSIFSN